ncbi:MAG: alpha-amylase [Ignavibacteriales bacterium]|nr:alpha-amylase [Ignavibacteriales bacterium]
MKVISKLITSIILLPLLLSNHSLPQNNFPGLFKTPDWAKALSIYEVNIRQFTEAGTFKEFEKHLPRLNDVGAGILWLMPINPIGEKNRKGPLGSYYSVKDYLAVNPEFGSLDDFKSLVNKAHAMGMYIIVDWVANHSAWDNVWVGTHPDFYTKDSAGNFVPPIQDWGDVIDLNYDNKDLWKEMINALKYWVKECDIDGYRCDVAGMVPIKFWIEARKELEKIKPVFMLAEWDTPEIHEAFDMSYDWNFHKIMNSIYKEEMTASDIVEHFTDDKKYFPADAIRMLFTSNHDENSWNGTEFERLGEAAETFAVLTCVLPGMPLVYSGQEAGFNKRLSFFDKDTIIWKEHPMKDIYKKLFMLRNINQALLPASSINFFDINDDDLLLFSRCSEDEKVFSIFNLSKDEKEFSFDDKSISGNFRNYFTGELVDFSISQNLKLNPWSYKIFVKQ